MVLDQLQCTKNQPCTDWKSDINCSVTTFAPEHHSLILQVTNLAHPYGNCTSRELLYYSHYSVSACSLNCEGVFVRDECLCRNFYMPTLGLCELFWKYTVYIQIIISWNIFVPHIFLYVGNTCMFCIYPIFPNFPIVADFPVCDIDNYISCSHPKLGKIAVMLQSGLPVKVSIAISVCWKLCLLFVTHYDTLFSNLCQAFFPAINSYSLF